MRCYNFIFSKGQLLFLLLLFNLPAISQQDIAYHMNIAVNPQTKTFRINGTGDFLADSTTEDSLVLIIGNAKGTVTLGLTGTAYQLTTRGEANSAITYCLTFDKSVSPGTHMQFTFVYEGRTEPSFQYYLDSTYFMASGYGTAWYPQFISHSKHGETSYCRARGELTVVTPNPFLPVMASATSQVSSGPSSTTTVFNYTQPDIFSLYVGTYTCHRFSGVIPFYTYSLSSDIDGEELSRKSAEVLDYLSQLFGPLAIPNFSIIELPQAIAERTNLGGASLLGGVVMPTDALRRFNYALFGHEISHQWWGNQVRVVGEKGAALLSEGLAQYGSLQVVLRFDPAHALTYRKTGYPGYIYDQSGLGYLKNVAAKNDGPLASLQGINSHLIADSKGFLALNLLSEIMGKASFHTALRRMQKQYEEQGLSWQTFLRKLDEVHGTSLNWFYQQWFERTGAPAWTASWKVRKGEVTLTLQQQDSLYRVPLTILIQYTDGTATNEIVWMQHKTDVFHLAAHRPVKNVVVDPYFHVLHWAEDLTPVADELSKAQKVLMLIYQQKLEDAEQLARSYLGEDPIADPYGLQFTLWTFIGRIKSVENKNDEALAAYQKAVQCVIRPPELLARTYYKIAGLAAGKGDKTLTRQAAANAVYADALNGGAEGMAAKVKPLL